ncbi:MAG: hypothetical protein NTV72_01275 [Candidatus Taylorbacteria bacterium]|nr:hypothetical protein [Candidatus Taylorbacteria bacterium]
MRINLHKDIDAEIKIFFNFLNNKDFPQHRNIVFFKHPELKEKIENIKDSKEQIKIIAEFISFFRKKYSNEIDKATEYIDKEIENKGNNALFVLENLMDFSNNAEYIIIPTIYPLCPFFNNTFFYSIYDVKNGKVTYDDVVSVSMHEISHMILFEILEKNNIFLNKELIYFVKEIIAPVLVYQDDFNGLFEKEIIGNIDATEIRFSMNGKTIKAFDFFNEMFIKNKKEGKNFNDFLLSTINICKKIENGIIEKHNFWNKNGFEIMNNKELQEQFKVPIPLNI